MSTTTIARRVASVPVRTSSETWKSIVDLIAAPESDAAIKLLSITGLAGMVISEEATAVAPILIMPALGARVRVYTVHGESAIETEGLEPPLSVYPTAEPGWTLSLPCAAVDLEFATATVATLAEVVVRDMNDGLNTPDGNTEGVRGSISADTDWMDSE